MGKGLAFLQKKTWHPGTKQNLEEKRKKEHQHAQEQQQLEELKRQIEDERNQEELHHQAAQSGFASHSSQLEWMYKGDPVGEPLASNASELPKPAQSATAAEKSEQPANDDLQRMNQPASLGTDTTHAQQQSQQDHTMSNLFQSSSTQDKNEQWQRLHNDPLLAMKQAQQQAVQQVKSNPVQMEAIKKEVASAKQPKASTSSNSHGKPRGEDRKTTSRKRRRRHHDDEDEESDDSSDSEDGKNKKRKSDHSKRHRKNHVKKHEPSRSRERPQDGGKRNRSLSRSPPRKRHEASARREERDAGTSERRSDKRNGQNNVGDKSDGYGLEQRAATMSEWRKQRSQEEFEKRRQQKEQEEARKRQQLERSRSRASNSTWSRKQKLTEEEKQRKLEAMRQDGTKHEARRSSRASAVEREEAEGRSAKDIAAGTLAPNKGLHTEHGGGAHTALKASMQLA